jgi:hypothetical protein
MDEVVQLTLFDFENAGLRALSVTTGSPGSILLHGD